MLEYLRPWIDLYKVDLKSFDEQHYHQLGGRLQPILDTIRRLHAMGIWVEIVTLLIPGFNDSDEELTRHDGVPGRGLAGYSLARDRLPRDYKMSDTEDTTAGDAACGQPRSANAPGLRYVYAGNIPGGVGELENTRCAECHELLIARHGYRISAYRITAEGNCPSCGRGRPGTLGSGFPASRSPPGPMFPVRRFPLT